MTLPIPKSVIAKDRDGALTIDESSYILDSTLNAKHRKQPKIIAFIESFVRNKSIQQSSEEAGVARSLGYSWRHKKDIAVAIQKLTDKSVVKHGFDNSEIFERGKEIVTFDPIDVQRPDGSYIDTLHEIPAEARRNIKKMKCKNVYATVEDLNGVKTKIVTGQIIEYEFYDKLKAMELVGREKQMFVNTTRVEHDVTKDMANVLLASAKRADKAIETIEVVEVINDKRE